MARADSARGRPLKHAPVMPAPREYSISEVDLGHERGPAAPPDHLAPAAPYYEATRPERLRQHLFVALLLAWPIVGLLLLLAPWRGPALEQPDQRGAATGALAQPLEPLPLDSPLGSLTILAEPAGAAILVDDRAVGAGPLQEVVVEPGHVWVTVHHEAYHGIDTLVYVSAGEHQLLQLRLEREPRRRVAAAAPEPRAQREAPTRARPAPPPSPAQPPPGETVAPGTTHLVVTAHPAGATILIDGVPAGRGQLIRSGLPPGRYMIGARLEGYDTAAQTITLEAGRARVVDLELRRRLPETGRLFVTVRPRGSVYLDGALLATDAEEAVTTAAAGTRRVRAVHPELGAREVDVLINPGRTASVVISLVPQ